MRDNVEAWLAPVVLSAVAELGATLLFDVYFYDEDD
jgi:hypothetical protein